MLTKCPKCGIEFDNYSKWGNKKFCSRKCANSRIQTKESIKHRIQKMKETVSTWDIEKRNARTNKILETRENNQSINKITRCVICGNNTNTRDKKTCSTTCYKELQSQNAIKQRKHGGGHKGKYKGFQCDSTYELAFLIWNLDHNINIKRCTTVYEYYYKNKKRKYLPDFEIDGKIYEIKGYYTDKDNAKLSQNTNIILVNKVDIKKYINWVKQKYKVNNLYMLYDNLKHIKHVCQCCGKIFFNYKKTVQFCSRKCSGIHRRNKNIINNKCGWYVK